MNGIPKLDALRSISLYGLSSITMNFEFDTDPYFAREQAFERIPNAEVPDGVTPGMSPLFSPSGLIYRYVLQSPDRSAQELKILEDWVLERQVPRDPGRRRRLGPRRRRRCSTRCSSIRTELFVVRRHACRRSSSSSPTTTPTRAAASTRRAASSTTCAASAW